MTLFYAVEVDAYRPGGASGAPPADAWAVVPWGVLSNAPAAVESYDTIRASDLGYRTAPADAGGVVVYPPHLNSAFAIDRRLNLAPTAAAAGAAWGSVSLANTRNRYDAIAAADNCDGRGVRVYVGAKTLDPSRGYLMDPPRAALTPLFTGIATPWFCSDTSLDVPIRDATYWLERPAQTALYGGTGGLDGGTDIKGLPKPKTRGSVRQVTPVLVDAVNRIYQWTDNRGVISAVYEGGATGITYAGDVADLYSGTTPAGQYRTNQARGLFQLGSTPVRTITLDASGDFVTPAAGSVSTVASLARWFMLDDMGLPPSLLDVGSFAAADAAYPYTAGFFIGTSPTDGVTVAGAIVGSLAGKIIPTRTGTLRLVVLRVVPANAAPSATFTRQNAVSLTPRPLGTPLDPPPYRWQVGYARAWTVQTSNLSGSITPAMTQFLAASDRFSVWVGTAVQVAYRRPSDPPQVPTYLANAADALAVANDLGALWGARRRVYDLVLPVALGMQREIGDVVRIAWPMDNLAGGALGQVVGEQFRAGDSQITLQVLV